MGSSVRHKHVDPAVGRGGSRGALALLALAVVASATISGSATADEASSAASVADGDPQRVLQSVAVDVGPDGSITAIDSTNISKTDSSDLSSTTDSFDPTETAGGLPVRILTSYRLDDRSGTDLGEIEGESGRVVVEVTVQNTTVRPQKLTYDVDSTPRTQYALVGAPLTVVATADLGSSGLSRIVTDDGGRGTSDSVTNGVLSRTDDDSVEVQWASLLAPPRLSPSTTFRLVQETDSFEVPTFDINVQPGLVTDTSVQGLLEAAFSDEAGSTFALESDTVDVISKVTGSLEDASTGLTDIAQLLDSSARTIGQRTISDLTSSSASITTELATLSGDLDELNSDIDRQLQTTQSSTLSQLSSTVEAIKSSLGDPGRTATPPPVKVAGCNFDFAGNIFAQDATVFSQLLRVQSQLTAIGTASRKCAGDLAQDLRDSIGSTGPGFSCTDDPEALICALEATKDRIDAQAVDLADVGADVSGSFDANHLENLRTGLLSFNRTFGDLQRTASSLVDEDDDSVGPVLKKLLALREGLNDLQMALQPDAENSIPSTLQSINDQAQIAASALGSGPGSPSVGDQARSAAAAACALVTPEVTDIDGRDQVSLLLTGKTCLGLVPEGSEDAGSRSVAQRADAALSAVQQIQSLSDIDSPTNPVATQLENLRFKVGVLFDSLGEININTADLQKAVNGLSSDLGELGAGTQTLPSDARTCPDAAPEDEDELTALNRAVGQIYCEQVGLASGISDVFGEAGTVLDEVQDDLTDGQRSANDSRLAARDSAKDTTAALSKRLDRAGNALRTKGAREIEAQRRRLDGEVDTVTRLLSDDIADAVKLIDTRVRTANGNLDESQRRLVADLARVLTDIGDKSSDGSGLLGALASGASKTRSSNRAIVDISNAASSFRNLRSAAMEDTLLQREQLSRSLDLQQKLPAFGVTLPEGSRSVSVYSFHVSQA